MYSFIIKAADALPCETPPGVTAPNGGTAGCAVPISSFNELFGNVLGIIVPFAGVGLFIMLMIGGFKYITSGGNPKALESAKATITYAVIGMVLVAGAYLVIELIVQLTGAPITEFEIGA